MTRRGPIFGYLLSWHRASTSPHLARPLSFWMKSLTVRHLCAFHTKKTSEDEKVFLISIHSHEKRHFIGTKWNKSLLQIRVIFQQSGWQSRATAHWFMTLIWSRNRRDCVCVCSGRWKREKKARMCICLFHTQMKMSVEPDYMAPRHESLAGMQCQFCTLITAEPSLTHSPYLGGRERKRGGEGERGALGARRRQRSVAFALTHSENTIILLPLGCEIVRPLLNMPPS